MKKIDVPQGPFELTSAAVWAATHLLLVGVGVGIGLGVVAVLLVAAVLLL